jgi:osmotically inducible lipoprotein OsmB
MKLGIIMAAAAGLTLSACATQQQAAGTATGAVAGAVVGGPVGAIAGGAVGAAVTAPGAPLASGVCYVTDRQGRVLVDRSGRARTRRC